MDPLSDLLSLLKPRSFITAGFDAGGSWALALDDLAGRIKCYAVIRGTCWLRAEGTETAVQIAAGDCFVLPSGRNVVISSAPDIAPRPARDVLDPLSKGNTVSVNGGGDCYLVGSRFEISGRHAALLLRSLPPLIRVRTGSGGTRLRACIEIMMEEMREARAGSSLMAQQLSHMMLVQALRLHVEEQGQGETGWLAALADPHVGQAIRAMHADPGRAWTLQALARQVGLSRTVFAQRFRQKTGATPIAYLTRWRMMLAGERLIGTADSIAEIAASLGYESEFAFAAAFKREMGCPPRRYIREAMGDAGQGEEMNRVTGRQRPSSATA
jgi:AraC-like DNA-binding protein